MDPVFLIHISTRYNILCVVLCVREANPLIGDMWAQCDVEDTSPLFESLLQVILFLGPVVQGVGNFIQRIKHTYS